MNNDKKDMIVVKRWLYRAKADELSEQSGQFNASFADIAVVKKDDEEFIGFLGKIDRETEKAVALKVEIDAVDGEPRTTIVWFPKSQIIDTHKNLTKKD